MNKTEYKESLRKHYPDEPDRVLELAWHFHSLEKAKKYITLLETCNRNADLASKAVRLMYVSCDVDAVKAVSEKFIAALLPFTCMEKRTGPHSAAYHIRKMLNEPDVRQERKAEERRLKQAHRAHVSSGMPVRTTDVIIQIHIRTDNEEFVRQIMLLASQSNAVFVKVEGDSDPHPTYHTMIPVPVSCLSSFLTIY